jgi:hypothetical protein
MKINKQPLPKDKRFQDLTGRTFGKYAVIGFEGRDKTGNRLWFCRCFCGNERIVRGASLTRGGSRSCGCWNSELISKAKTIHGKTDSSEYAIWTGIKARCYNIKNPSFMRYGGRGIKMCERWKNSFIDFLSDVGSKPERMSLDRKNNDGNYTPGNCRWATRREQSNNTRNNRFIEFRGTRKTIADWSRRLHVPDWIIPARIASGWSIKRALTQPVKTNRRRVSLSLN